MQRSKDNSNVSARPGKRLGGDRQLRGIKLKDVLEKSRLGLGLTIKEFAVRTGLSYSAARASFQLPNFPAFRKRFVFWDDFLHFKNVNNSLPSTPESRPQQTFGAVSPETDRPAHLPARAARILHQSNNGTESDASKANAA